ncbi:hypothetical protein CYLTODRAFT_362318 [Cylindrobasidium torrendii FP15055 ss-10]|uniref:Uncharacterized protein n=1 Tax=Cylindrobasidium torrendii FP15055 ss-10 TaxID=1314674 RepID=A0A0D7AVF4_9AGAR|nr:hypothetical protein CYLTODRAFT_362318 [Cylindrobasidium torrendii FP15055 ss-10]
MSINHHHHHHRSNSAGRSLSPRRASTSSAERSTSPGPTQTFHPHILPRSVPTPALVESAASGAHYAGIKVDGSQHRANNHEHQRRSSAHNDVELAADHGRVLDDLKEIFSCRATVEIFERSWHKDAVFEDQLACARGYAEYTAQVCGLHPKIFSKSEQLSMRLMSSTSMPNRIVYAQSQAYTAKWINKTKVIDSIIVVDLDEDNKVVHLADQWNGKLPTWWGNQFLRRANGYITSYLVSVPKTDTKTQ